MNLVSPFGLTQLLAQSSALADIRGNRAARDQLARLVPNRTDRERNGDLAPIGSAMNELPVLDTFPASRSLDQLACLLGRVVCEEHRERPPDRLLRAIAVDPSRAYAPTRDRALSGNADDGIRGCVTDDAQLGSDEPTLTLGAAQPIRDDPREPDHDKPSQASQERAQRAGGGEDRERRKS